MLTAIIEKTKTGGGSFTSVNCPHCDKFKTLSGAELGAMTAFCDECGKVFKLIIE